MEDRLPSFDVAYRRLGVEEATRARGRVRGAREAARIWREERAIWRDDARTMPCILAVSLLKHFQRPSGGSAEVERGN